MRSAPPGGAPFARRGLGSGGQRGGVTGSFPARLGVDAASRDPAGAWDGWGAPGRPDDHGDARGARGGTGRRGARGWGRGRVLSGCTARSGVAGERGLARHASEDEGWGRARRGIDLGHAPGVGRVHRPSPPGGCPHTPASPPPRRRPAGASTPRGPRPGAAPGRNLSRRPTPQPAPGRHVPTPLRAHGSPIRPPRRGDERHPVPRRRPARPDRRPHLSTRQARPLPRAPSGISNRDGIGPLLTLFMCRSTSRAAGRARALPVAE